MVSDKNASKRPAKASDRTDVGKTVPNVGDVLRRAYDETVSEAVPDDLLALLKQLD